MGGRRNPLLYVGSLWLALACDPAAAPRQDVAGCRPAPPADPQARRGAAHAPEQPSGQEFAPARSDSLRLLTWNVEWLFDPDRGPADDAAQFEAVSVILAGSDADLIALQEVTSAAGFERLRARLPRFSGALSSFEWTQKMALLFDDRRFALQQVRQMEDVPSAGRPPLDVRLEERQTGQPLRVVVVHAKARDDMASYAARVRFAAALRTQLDARPQRFTVVMGDFNDLLVGSILAGQQSPYAALLEGQAYVPLTASLNGPDPAEGSSRHGSTIDHIVVSAPLAGALIPGSVDVLQQELLVRYSDFTRRISDHFPVTVTLASLR